MCFDDLFRTDRPSDTLQQTGASAARGVGLRATRPKPSLLIRLRGLIQCVNHSNSLYARPDKKKFEFLQLNSKLSAVCFPGWPTQPWFWA
jgi:hypothetical protein